MEDLAHCALPAVRHRLALNFDGLSEGVRIDDVLEQVLSGAMAAGKAVRA
jgi:hypothetical protein